MGIAILGITAVFAAVSLVFLQAVDNGKGE